MSNVSILMIPGLSGSGPAHWQTAWEKHDTSIKRVEQNNWEEPQLNEWMHTLEAYINEIPSPVILVAHSLGVSLVAHWAKQANGRIQGALLVAPADVDSPAHTPEIIRNFSPIPLDELPFPSIVVASENDPYVTIERAEFFAQQWGSRFVNVGKLGHINADSNLGLWPDGLALLGSLK